MTAYDDFQNDMFLQKFGRDVFESRKRAASPRSAMQVAGVMAAGVAAVALAAFFTLQPIGGSDSAIAQGAALTKSDRMDSTLPSNCQGQAWGAWSSDCAAAISGTGAVRQINFVTVKQPAPTENTTVLERVPTNS
ncbi:hypothetical protein [Roseibium polysiphoniae]|uniref:Uncharacterized protein n=1 Tax=Roseibium polysiphoniae TaxID=2571221 RepID=A0ABR9C7Z0_9HYPH|nr:hypothetical protein [Roseibium polysiphoniae]MBD8876010.1 hypothetical protein [Roseibium polysiphoniae]